MAPVAPQVLLLPTMCLSAECRSFKREVECSLQAGDSSGGLVFCWVTLPPTLFSTRRSLRASPNRLPSDTQKPSPVSAPSNIVSLHCSNSRCVSNEPLLINSGRAWRLGGYRYPYRPWSLRSWIQPTMMWKYSPERVLLALSRSRLLILPSFLNPSSPKFLIPSAF